MIIDSRDGLGYMDTGRYIFIPPFALYRYPSQEAFGMTSVMNNFYSQKYLLATLGICLFISSVTARAEQMERIRYNNPGLIVDLGVGLWACPLPIDYDHDGDYDLLVSCVDKPYAGLYYFENIDGNTKMPIFESAKKLANGQKNIQISYIDGKAHFLTLNHELVNFRENKFTKKLEIYPKKNVHQTNTRIRANQWKYCDFDGDGDLDLIVGVGDWTDYGWDNAFDGNGKWKNGPLHGYVYLLRNNGSTDKPDYADPEKIKANGKPIDVYGMPSPNIADFDKDGDLDIICGEFIDKFTYFENIGTRKKPRYSRGRFLKYADKTLKMDLCMITPVAIDWDKDGDIDLVVGQEDGRVAFMENTGKIINRTPQFLPPVFFQQKADYVKFGALSTPFSFDWDSDGDEDLICGNTAGYIGFIENLGFSGHQPKWAEPVYLRADGEIIRIMAGNNGSIQGPCETKWGYTAVNVSDWDHDGLADIIVNSIIGKIVWFKNIGTIGAPQLAASKPVEVEWETSAPKPAWNWWQPENKELVTQWRTTPVVIDLNKDGLNDLLIIDHEGYLSLFERFIKNEQLKLYPGKRIFSAKSISKFDSKGNGQNESGGLLQLNNKQAGGSGRRKFCIVDWNNDGKLDLLVNGINVNFLRNISTVKNEYLFIDSGNVHSHILAGHTTSPTVVDWDKNGSLDLLIGAEDGHFYYLTNPATAK